MTIPSKRIAVLSPVAWRTPPRQYGAWETVAGNIAEGLVSRGWDVTLFATGDSVTRAQLHALSLIHIYQTGQDEGVVGVAGNVSYSVNGGRVEYNNWEVDGGDMMDNGSNDTLNVYPSVDAIAEVKVLTSNYGAQYGRNGSGTVETVTKSGTKDFHGDLFEFLRNDDFNARNYFSYTAPLVPEYKKNDFGGTFGGPVFIPHVYNTSKQKTFFFFSEEIRREIVPGGIFTGQVPSAQERQGNFSDVCPEPGGSMADCPMNPATGMPYPNNTVPVDPNAKDLLALLPLPNLPNNIYSASPALPTHWHQELGRIDEDVYKRQHQECPKCR